MQLASEQRSERVYPIAWILIGSPSGARVKTVTEVPATSPIESSLPISFESLDLIVLTFAVCPV